MNVNNLAQWLGDACYLFLTINFFWGLFCIVMAWRRVSSLSYPNQREQEEFLSEFMDQLGSQRFEEATQLADSDSRALPQLAYIAVANRELGYEPLRHHITEIMQRDVLGELENRVSWIATTIKSGPLLGLFGTVLGMMAAFGRLGDGTKIDAAQIADEISIALICTAMGLATAIPFNFLLAAINVRRARLQDSLTFGLVRILDYFRKQEL